MSTFERALLFVLAQEGGYSNDPADPGGETRYGISKRQYPAEDIRNLTSLTDASFLGRRGRASVEYLDENGDPQTSPACGDPAYIYIHVRATTPPDAIGVDLGAYGMEPVSAVESAAVLGVWL